MATPGNAKHLDHLDGWRGFAIMAVLVGHFFYQSVLNVERLGVELFFVLSGRLMAEILFIRTSPLPHFFRRRISRVWPAFAVFVLVIAVVFSQAGPYHVSGFDTLAALTFITNYVGAAGHRCEVFGHIWSLCIEEHSYLFLGLVALLVRQGIANASLTCLIAAGLCMLNGAYQTLVLHGGYFAVYWRTDTRASSILLSCGLYLAFHERESLRAMLNEYSCLIFGALGVLLSFSVVPDVVRYSIGTACLALAICSIDRADRRVLAIFSHPIIVQIGIVSFSLYLWQQPFVHLKSRAHLLLVPLGLLSCALASFYLIEQPARRYLNRVWGSRPSQPITAGAAGLSS